MISAKMAAVNVRIARARAFLAKAGWPRHGHWKWAVRMAWRDLHQAERRQRHLRRLEGTA